MRLNQVTVSSQDVSRAAEFYLKLGFQWIVDDRPNYVRFQCPQGDATFSIQFAEHFIAQEGTTIYFECDQLDKTVHTLKAAGVRFEQDPVDQSWLWREAYLRDPDGHRICLYRAAKNRLNPPWRVVRASEELS